MANFLRQLYSMLWKIWVNSPAKRRKNKYLHQLWECRNQFSYTDIYRVHSTLLTLETTILLLSVRFWKHMKLSLHLYIISYPGKTVRYMNDYGLYQWTNQLSAWVCYLRFCTSDDVAQLGGTQSSYPIEKDKPKKKWAGRRTVKKGGGEDAKNPNRVIGTREGQTRPFQQSMVGCVTEGHAYAKGGTPAMNPGQDGPKCVCLWAYSYVSHCSLQTPHQSSNFEESPTQLEARSSGASGFKSEKTQIRANHGSYESWFWGCLVPWYCAKH